MSKQSELVGLARTTSLDEVNAAYSAGALSNRNLIINGAMQVAQRGTSFTDTAAAYYTLDRFKRYASGGGLYTTSQDSNSPDGFSYSLKLTNTTTDDPASSDYYILQHSIEGYNTAHLNWGTSSAKTVTFSFWVRSSVTGTYSFAMVNSGSNRSYAAAYTISSADTWEYKTVTISGDTTGTWDTTNGIGIKINFDLGSGSAFLGTAGTWASANYHGAIGQTEWINNSGATFQITGVQLEVGDTAATPFEHRSYGDELARCMRYFEVQGQFMDEGGTGLDTYTRLQFQFKATKRTAPTITLSPSSNTDGSAAGVGGAWFWRNNNHVAVGEETTYDAEL